mgnify:CR=1 FL=1
MLIAFNPIPVGEDGWIANPPGTMPKFTLYKDTDYEFALNKVAAEHGGGTEVWKLLVPGMPRKHFYPRQPKSRFDGPVKEAKLEISHDGNTRIVEAAIPWETIPEVKALMEAGKPVKFSYRVNDDGNSGTMELSKNRSVSRNNNYSFHPDWKEHWANELEFGFEE